MKIMINNEFVMLILELPNYGHQFLLLYCCQNTKELFAWRSKKLLGRLSYFLSHILTVSSMKAWEKLASTINSALAQFSLATLVFSCKEDPKFAQPFCFHARASAICEYRDWFHLHVCVESHKVLRFVLQTIIWSLPMSNSWYHNFYYGAVHRYNNSMPIPFSFLYS